MHIYLYVKQHQSTGLLYFGKTTCQDPFKYTGSGLHWKRHLKKHGNNISTIDVWGFDSQDACTRFALEFSEKHHIVESNEWANLIPENGMNGGMPHSEETRAKMRVAKLGKKRKPFSEEHKAKLRGKKHTEETRAKMRARTFSEETRVKLRVAMRGKPKSEEHKAKLRAAMIGKNPRQAAIR